MEENEEKLKWNGSQVDFVSFVDFFSLIGRRETDNPSDHVNDLGEVFLKIFELDIAPYQDFKSMRLALSRSSDPASLAKKLLDHMNAEDSLEEAVSDTNVEPSVETMVENMVSWMSADDFVNRLSKYVEFRKD